MSTVHYSGPQCPVCTVPLDPTDVRTGNFVCRACGARFEATAFSPREVRHTAVQVVTETPEGVAAACANHARNAAVSSCGRCGLFICALCEMNVGGATYCPSCFDRMRTDGALAGVTRYRDWASMAVSAAFVGLFCNIPVGPFAIYWAIRGIKQRRTEGGGAAGPIIALILGGLETIAGLVFLTLMIVGMAKGGTS